MPPLEGILGVDDEGEKRAIKRAKLA